VTDREAPAGSLRFEWTSDAGTFLGTGSTVSWRAPQTAGTVTLRLSVTETYIAPDASGLPVSKEQVTTGSVAVRVHDEVAEIGGMARDFLERFSQSAIGPDDVVRNFQQGCGNGGTGKQDERQQVADNRRNFRILSSSVGNPRVTVDFDGVSPYRLRHGDAWIAVDVEWNSQCLRQDPTIACPSVGATRRDGGIDWLTARFDEPTDRWWLCDSDFESLRSTTATRYRR
jgi:hypothetical protein